MARKQVGAASVADTNDAATTADVARAAGTYISGNTVATTSYTFGLADVGTFVHFTNSSAVTATVPLNSSVAFPLFSRIDCAVLGTGMVTVVGAGGVTVNGTPSLVSRAQYTAFSLIKYATDTWLMVGALA